MTTTTWPDPARPGVPLNPEKDGWHWLKRISNGWETLAKWDNGWNGNDDFWWNLPGYSDPEKIAKIFCYLGPVLTPDEAAALLKRVAELEGALDFYACVDHYQTHNAAAPNVVQFDRGAKARAALGGKDE